MNTQQHVHMAAVIGLMAGIGHGIISHNANLPVSLMDQFFQPLQISQTPRAEDL